MTALAEPPAEALAFVEQLADQLLAAGPVVAAYLHGSAVLGGWIPARSDLDLLVVADDAIGDAAVTALSHVLATAGRTCPAQALEASLVTLSQARRPAPPWPYLIHVNAGPGHPARLVRPATVHPAAVGSRPAPADAAPVDAAHPDAVPDGGGFLAGDRDLLMHYAVSRAAGWPVIGPSPAELIGPVARPIVLSYLADELDWGLGHAAEPYAVLNACRALIYLAEGALVSKIDGGEAALARQLGPPGVIARALAQQRGLHPAQPPAPDAAAFARATATELRSAAAA